MGGEGSAVDQLSAGFGEGAFFGGWEAMEEFGGDGELEDGVAKEFEALVIVGGLFVPHEGGVGEGLMEESPILERVAQLFLELAGVRHLVCPRLRALPGSLRAGPRVLHWQGRPLLLWREVCW